MKNIATAASRACSLSEGTKLATRAASTMRVACEPTIPNAMNLFLRKRSTRKIAITFIPNARVSHAVG